MTASQEMKNWGMGAVPLITVTRGQEPDLVHTGMACLVNAQGKILWSLGDANTYGFLRSCAKPFQAIPVISSGAAQAYQLSEKDLAIICGSHLGGPDQLTQVMGLLTKGSLTTEALQCGDGLSDMCSGKHAGMLLGCRHRGFPIDAYLDPNHPWQKEILEAICFQCDIQAQNIRIAEDGCSAPTFSLPLYHIALGFARLAQTASVPGPAQRILKSMAENPLGFTGEPDLSLINLAGSLITKGGVNGILCAAIPGRDLGFAIKVIDGSPLPRWPVLTEALLRANIISTQTAKEIEQTLWPAITTRRGKIVGGIRIDF